MQVIGINGSPRGQGNTSYFLNFTLEKLGEHDMDADLINLENLNIGQCRGCYYCQEHKECEVQDDFTAVFSRMLAADGIIIGSPVYHSAVTSKLKALLNRAGFVGRWKGYQAAEKDNYQWKTTAFSGKIAAPITVARRAGQNFAFAELILWMTVNDLIVVGSNYWSIGVAGRGGAFDAEEDEEALVILEHLAANISSLLKKLY